MARFLIYYQRHRQWRSQKPPPS